MEGKLWLGAQRNARREKEKGLEEGYDSKMIGEIKEEEMKIDISNQMKGSARL